jgi:hypothetical protein
MKHISSWRYYEAEVRLDAKEKQVVEFSWHKKDVQR